MSILKFSDGENSLIPVSSEAEGKRYIESK
jgi:hypothetical protein